MNRLMSSVSRFLEKYIHKSSTIIPASNETQAVERGWDIAENNSPSLEANIVGASGYYRTLTNMVTEHTSPSVCTMNNSIFSLSLHCGQEISFRLIDNNNTLEIEYNDEVIEPIIENGKIILGRAYDEENNASQDTRTYETSNENGLHGSTNMLQLGDTVFYTQT